MSIHKQVLALAIPMIVANLSTPLLGLVDTAVMGHLPNAKFLAATAMGGLIFNFIFWGFGFLRMGVTGITAQAYGQNDSPEQFAILSRALLLALFLASLILILQRPILEISLLLLDSQSELQSLIKVYFNIRIYSAPATLCNYALIGWFIGTQNVKYPLAITLLSNSSNILLDIVLVNQWHLDISGVAYASVAAEYIGLCSALLMLNRRRRTNPIVLNWHQILNRPKIRQLLLINQNLFIRTLCLIFSFAFFTAQGSQFGDTIVAANAVLLNFVTFMSYALDGIAHAAEALVGSTLGKGNFKRYQQTIHITGLWSLLIAVIFSAVYFVYGSDIIRLLTDLTTVRNEAEQYLPWLIIIPILSFGCFLLDGIFIGAAWTRAIRNTMLIATGGFFMPTWLFSQAYENQGLWLSLSIFFLARTLLMTAVLAFKNHTYKKKAAPGSCFPDTKA